MTVVGICGASILNAYHAISQHGPDLHCLLNTLVCQKAGAKDGRYADIAHNVVKIGRMEKTSRGLLQYDFIVLRRKPRRNLPALRSFRNVESRQFIVEASVTTILGEILHNGIGYLNPALARGW